MEPGYIVEYLQLQWQSELNLADNMQNIVEEFKTARNLLPIHIIIHGPHGAGKTILAKKLCDYYGCHYVSIKTMIEETIAELVGVCLHLNNIRSILVFRKHKLKTQKTKSKTKKKKRKSTKKPKRKSWKKRKHPKTTIGKNKCAI